ncbi:MAG: major facilitator transporter [Xanthobacteraceae bacterium]|nr:MAG: major facilitator transporter [Xanthobacteraceae bacterium]
MALLILLSVGMLIVGFGAFGVLGVITPMSRDLALTPVGAGWIVSAYALAYAIGSPLGASLTGRLDRRTVLIIGMGLIAAGALCWPAAPGSIRRLPPASP